MDTTKDQERNQSFSSDKSYIPEPSPKEMYIYHINNGSAVFG